jgi:tetratricopeptide (TPR) repeat protein
VAISPAPGRQTRHFPPPGKSAKIRAMTLADVFNLALQRHHAGDLAEAERLYRQVLAMQPDQPDALRLLGVVMCQTGRRPEALEVVRRAVALRPEAAEFHFDLAGVLRSMGQIGPAIAAYQRAVQLRPDFVEAFSLLGETLKDAGLLDQAVVAAGRVAELRPDLAETHCNFGHLLNETGQWDRAIVECNRSIQIRPDLAGAYNNLGIALNRIGDMTQSIAAYRKAIELEPNSAQFRSNLAITLCENRDLEEAMVQCRRAIELRPDDPVNYSNLGSIHGAMGDLDQAEAAYRHALKLRPDYLEVYCNLGHLFYFKGLWDQAEAVYHDVLARKPDHPQAHWSLALIYLSRGDYQRGWDHYEWRWRVKELRMRRRTDAPRWDGGDLNGRAILIHNEQGFGDTIQFIRYLPEVARRGGKIILACQRELFSLLETFPHIHQCVPNDQPVSGYEVLCPLLSLPGLFQTRVQSIPADVPYLRADPVRSQRWRERLADDGRLKVGLVWAGRPKHPNDRNRSIPLERLAPLAGAPRARFISLQTGQAAGQAKTAPMPLDDWTGELADFAETAALIDNLDLVISVDTAVIHLAGALGKRVWVLLPFIPDWRWMMEREDSPWYPTMRLFRQEHIGEWEMPIEQVAKTLQSITR